MPTNELKSPFTDHAFYVPRSHPDGFSVNARCLDAGTVESMTVEPFDGREWEKSVAARRGDW